MADKGGNVVLVDTYQYKAMCPKILDNRSWYRKGNKVDVKNNNENFLKFVDRALNQGTITKELWEFVRTAHPILPTFYSLPKVPKNPLDPPGHPIVSGRCSVTQKLSEVVDSYLRPHVFRIIFIYTRFNKFFKSHI